MRGPASVCLPGLREGSSHGVGWCVEGISGPCSARIPRSRSGKKRTTPRARISRGQGRLPPSISSSPQRRFSESAAVGGGGGGSRCYPVPARASMLCPGPTLATQVRTRERTLSLLAARFGLGPGQGRVRKSKRDTKEENKFAPKARDVFAPLVYVCAFVCVWLSRSHRMNPIGFPKEHICTWPADLACGSKREDGRPRPPPNPRYFCSRGWKNSKRRREHAVGTASESRRVSRIMFIFPFLSPSPLPPLPLPQLHCSCLLLRPPASTE